MEITLSNKLRGQVLQAVGFLMASKDCDAGTAMGEQHTQDFIACMCALGIPQDQARVIADCCCPELLVAEFEASIVDDLPPVDLQAIDNDFRNLLSACDGD